MISLKSYDSVYTFISSIKFLMTVFVPELRVAERNLDINRNLREGGR